MKLLTGLFRYARKRTQTTDNDMGMFRTKLSELVEKKDSLPDEEVVKIVDELKEMTSDLPDADDKAKLDRFLEDFKSVKEQDEATAKEAASMVSDLFEKLDTEAMKDVPEVGGEEVPLTEGSAPGEAEVEETVEETVAPEDSAPGETDVEKLAAEVETKDDDPNSEYTLEEIYQFIKKRMAEDSATGDCGTQDDGEEVEKEEEKEEVVSDHAPRIPVTMNGNVAHGSLADLYTTLKKGGR